MSRGLSSISAWRDMTGITKRLAFRAGTTISAWHLLNSLTARVCGISKRVCGGAAEALSRGHPRAHRALDLGRCQRDPGLAHLRGLCARPHSYGARALCEPPA